MRQVRATTAMSPQCHPVLVPLQQRKRQILGFLSRARRRSELRGRAVQRGAVPGERVKSVVEVGDGDVAEHPQGPAQDLRTRPVVDPQPARPAGDADADGAQADVVAVDPLVRVAGEEQVVRTDRDRGAQQPPLRGVQVLDLVDDHVTERRAGARGDDPRRLVSEGEEGPDPLAAQALGERRERRPHLPLLALGEATPPAAPRGAQVLLLGVDGVRQHHLAPLLHEEGGRERTAGQPVEQLVVPLHRHVPVLASHDAQRPTVDVEHLDGAALLGVEQLRQVALQRLGQPTGVGGEQHRFRRQVPARHEVLDAVQCDDCLAGPRAAGHLRTAPVRGAVGDLLLGRVQEHPPQGQRLGEEGEQLVGPVDQRDPALCALDGGCEVLGVDGFGGDAWGDDVRPHLLDVIPGGQRLEDVGLALGHQGRERLQHRLVDDPARGGEHLVVDAEPAQVRVAHLREQPVRLGWRRSGAGQLLEGHDVAYLENAGDRVDRERPRPGPVDRVVVRQHPQEHVLVAPLAARGRRRARTGRCGWCGPVRRAGS